MLILNRKLDQVIEIGPSIRVIVMGLDGNRVRLGVEAPNDVEIVRPDVRDSARLRTKGAVEVEV